MMSLSVCIPTYRRGQVLLGTIEQLLDLHDQADEIIVIDQTEEYEQGTKRALAQLARSGAIRWIHLDEPSIPRAMNRGLLEARGALVLFLDDDIVLDGELVARHRQTHERYSVAAVVGRIIQPWEDRVLSLDTLSYPVGDKADPDAFRFNSGKRCKVYRAMAGNLSVKRQVAIAVGGFDENFVCVAYRFEAEFSDRLYAHGHSILFEPDASIRHLKVTEGGTRSFGEHFRTVHPGHSVGRYYYLLVAKRVPKRWRRLFVAPLQAVVTSFHMLHPWWIPLTLVAEFWGFFWALALRLQGPRYIDSEYRI